MKVKFVRHFKQGPSEHYCEDFDFFAGYMACELLLTVVKFEGEEDEPVFHLYALDNPPASA